MITLFQTHIIHSQTELKQRVKAYIKTLPNQITLVGHSKKILRFEFSCKKLNSLLLWLKNQDSDQKLYWEDRSTTWEMAGVGEAHVVTGEEKPDYDTLLTELRSRLSKNNPHLRYYGGFRFSKSLSDDDTWNNFNAYRFIIPRFEYVRTDQSFAFATNIALDEINRDGITNILAQLNQLTFEPSSSLTSIPHSYDRQDSPNKQEWKNLFVETLKHLDRHDYEKIVLARKSILNFSQPLDPLTLIEQLKHDTPNCFHFCFSPQKGKAFLGASPERLYKRSENNIKTEAIAGTRPRGRMPEEDKQLETELLSASKDAREHQYVVDFIKKSLDPICVNLNNNNKPHILKLNVGHHLITHFDGTLQNNIPVESFASRLDHKILSRLHPTPAVAGTPQDTALAYINKHEPFDRGLYAAPVGYVGYDITEFIVAIRSGLVQDRQLSIYAGAGIVTESKCDDEWNEIENKIGSFIKIFRNEPSKISQS